MTNKELNGHIQEYDRLSKSKKSTEERLDILKEIFRKEMSKQGSTTIYGTDLGIQWRNEFRNRFDVTRLKEENPSLYDLYNVKTQYNYFEVV